MKYATFRYDTMEVENGLKYKHKTNYPDELRKKIVRLVTRLCINASKQTDHPPRRTTRANSSEQTNYAVSSS